MCQAHIQRNKRWKPSEKIVIGLKVTKTKATFNLLSSAYSFNLYQENEQVINNPYQLVSDNSGQKAIVETCKIFVKALYKDIAGAVAEDNDRILDAIPERQPITDIQVAEHIGITQNIKASA